MVVGMSLDEVLMEVIVAFVVIVKVRSLLFWMEMRR